MVAAAAIDVEKMSLSRSLDKSVILEHRRLATAGTAAGPRRGGAGCPWVRPPIPPMITDRRVGVYPLPVPDDGDGGGAPGMSRARPLSVPFPSKDKSWGCVSVA